MAKRPAYYISDGKSGNGFIPLNGFLVLPSLKSKNPLIHFIRQLFPEILMLSRWKSVPKVKIPSA
jgi:hypothetical protein